MKNKILFLAGVIVVIAVAATSCKKSFLEDMKSYDKYDESVFTNETQTGWYIDRMYNYYFAGYKSPTRQKLPLGPGTIPKQKTRKKSVERLATG